MTMHVLSNAQGSARRLRLRSVPAGQAVLTGLIGRRWQWPGMASGRACEIRIDRVVPSGELPALRSAAFAWQGLEFWVVGAPRLFQVLCGFDPWLGEEPVASPGVGWRLRDVVAVLNNFCFSAPTQWIAPLAETAAWDQGAADLMALECSLWSGDGVWLDQFWLVPTALLDPFDTLPALLRGSKLLPREVAGLPAIPLKIEVVVGQASLPMSRLAQMETGDVLCFSPSFLEGGDRLSVGFPGGRMQFRILDAGRLELIAPVAFSKFSQGGSMDDELKMGDLSLEPAPSGPGDVLLDMPVRVQAVAGTLSLTVAEVARLKAGDVVDLDSPASASVRLVANGREVGVGELVEIDGRLGVQISRWDVAG